MPAAEAHEVEIDLGKGNEEGAEKGRRQEGLEDRQQAVAHLIQRRHESECQIRHSPHKDGDRKRPVLKE